MRPTIRQGTRADSATCWEIYLRAVREGAAPQYSDLQRRAWAPETAEPDWFAPRIAGGRTWIARTQGAACGFLTAAGLDADGPVHLDLFFVLPEVRRTGVADALYAAFAHAAARDRPEADLTAFASLLLRPFLERRGWCMLEEEWSLREGVRLNRFRMEKRASGADCRGS